MAGVNRMRRYAPLCLFAMLCMGTPCRAAAYAGPAAASPAPVAGTPEAALSPLQGLPYRVDGAVNDQGKYALFREPEKRLPSPGLNCSGFVLEASRLLLHADIPLMGAVRDRLGDSGRNAPLGQDWDFGWDLVLNISEGHPRSLLLPGGESADPAGLSGEIRGFDPHNPATWKELSARLRPGYLYLFSFNKPSARKGYTRQHYHVGLALVSAEGRIWYYHTTPTAGKVIRRDLATDRGRASFLRSFAGTAGKRKMVAIVEVRLP